MKDLFSSIFLSKGTNYLTDDLPFLEMLEYFKTKPDQDMKDLGKFVSEEMIESLDFIDHHAKPVLHMWSLLGERIDFVRLSPDHVRILKKLQDYGTIRKIYDHDSKLMYHFSSGYIISDSGIFCTLTLTAQTVYILEKYGSQQLKDSFYHKFVDHDNPWYGATFYSETQGGSDIGANKTVARTEGDHFLLDGGDKYFASDAGIADAALVTARIDGSVKGAKGISLFLVPAYTDDGQRNYSIRRLKDKMGTTAVPTGEVEFSNSTGYLIGDLKNGIYLAMEALIISRIDDAIAAVGIARKALWEAYRFAELREAFGKKLVDHPLMGRDLMELEIKLEGGIALSMLAADKFNNSASSRPPYDDSYQLARLLGNLAKSIAADTSAEVTRYSMEILGGIGFFEEFPMAKFHRDSIVTSIWEGTSNIQALETLEILIKKNGMELVRRFLNETISRFNDKNHAEALRKKVDSYLKEIERMIAKNEREFYSKEILKMLGKLVAASVMELMGQESKDKNMILKMTSRLYYKLELDELPLEYSDLSNNKNVIKWMSTPK